MKNAKKKNDNLIKEGKTIKYGVWKAKAVEFLVHFFGS